MKVIVNERHMDSLEHPCIFCMLRTAIAEAIEVDPDELTLGEQIAVASKRKANDSGKIDPWNSARISTQTTARFFDWFSKGYNADFEFELLDADRLI